MMETWRDIMAEMRDEEVDALKLENAKLRRALEPVMACDVNSMTMQSELERAVREAQKIMKGESK